MWNVERGMSNVERRLMTGRSHFSLSPRGRGRGEGAERRDGCCAESLGNNGGCLRSNPSPSPSRKGRGTSTRSAFTLFELLIAIAIIGLILASVIPFIMDKWELSRRLQCAQNLYIIRDAMNAYAKDHGSFPRVRYDDFKNPNGWTAYTGADDPNPFATSTKVQPNDVTASLWLLVREAYISDTSVFICPSSSDWQDHLYDKAGTSIVPAKRRGNFRSGHNLSYSMFCPFSAAPGFVWNDTLKPECALMADKNPGIYGTSDVTQPSGNAPPEAFAVANSNNHNRAGQNVLYADGSVQFERHPYCGVGYVRADPSHKITFQPGDNIYTALRAGPIPAGTHPNASDNGVFGKNVAPAWLYDSYLVPSAAD